MAEARLENGEAAHAAFERAHQLADESDEHAELLGEAEALVSELDE